MRTRRPRPIRGEGRFDRSTARLGRTIEMEIRAWLSTGEDMDLPYDHPDFDRVFDTVLAGMAPELGSRSNAVFAAAMGDACGTVVSGDAVDGNSGLFMVDMFFVPLYGPKPGLRSLATDEGGALTETAASFREHRIFHERSTTILVPLLVGPIDLLDLQPAATNALARTLGLGAVDLLQGRTTKEALLPILSQKVAEAVGGISASDEREGSLVFGSGALVGVRVVPLSSERETYRGDVLDPIEDGAPDPSSIEEWLVATSARLGAGAVSIDVPAPWDVAVPSLAALHVEGTLNVQRGMFDIDPLVRADEVHCLMENGTILVALRLGADVVGPCEVPGLLAAIDMPYFVSRLAGLGATIVNHADMASLMSIVGRRS